MESVKERTRVLLERGFGILNRHGHRPADLWGAIALLMRGQRGDVAAANRLILDWTRSQNRDVTSPQFGSGFKDEDAPVFDDGSFPRPSLYNAFAAPPLAVLFRRFSHLLQTRVQEACFTTMEAGVFEFLSRDLHLRGHNQHIGMTTGLIIYGTLLDQPAVTKKGIYRLLHYLQLGAYLTPMDEYNSPTYAAADLTMLAGVLMVARRADLKMAVRVAFERLALVLACHYHRPTLELAPPHYRAYHGALAQYAGGVAPFIFKMTGERRLIEFVPHGLHDVDMNFAAAALDVRICKTMQRLFLTKKWPFEVREVQGYVFPEMPKVMNSWIEVTSFYPDHENRCARVRAPGIVQFDTAQPGMVATTYMTQAYALGTFSTNSISSRFGYGAFHGRGFQFYYRPQPSQETYPSRFGFLAYPNCSPGGEDNDVQVQSFAGQWEGVALAAYQMQPIRTHACEVFCPFQCADGREVFHDSHGELSTGKRTCGPVFIRDGDVYIALVFTGGPGMRLERRSPELTGYPYYQAETIPVLAVSHYRGDVRDFGRGTTFSGGIAVAMGSSGEYASFDEFKKNWSKARLSLVKKKSGLALSLRGVRPALRIRAPDGRKRHPVIYVSGKRLETDTLECSHARQSQRGHPVEVENFRIDSDGRPVTAYSSPDGSSCVVLQPLPVPVDLNITSPTGKVRVKGLRLGRIELDSSSRSLRVESCSPIGGLSTTGQLRGLKEIVKCWSGRTAMPAIQDIEGS